MSGDRAGTRHLPNRPEWTCRIDELPWPCESARRELRLIWASDPIGLAVHMADRLYQATTELDEVPSELYARFVAWTRYRS